MRQEATGTDLFTALVGLVGRNKRRYGGYIVHLGIVLIFLGFAGEGFKQTEEALLKPGQQVQVGDFVVRHDALTVTDDGQKQMITAHVTVFRDGEEFATMYPAKWFFRKHEEQPTTEVAIQRGVRRRTSTSCWRPSTPATQTASLDVTINPLVNWVWVGFGILALGTVIALLPDTVFAFATAQGPGATPSRRRCCCSRSCCRRAWRSRQTTVQRWRPQRARALARKRDHVHLRAAGCRSATAA